MTPDLVVEADVSFAEVRAHGEEFDVRAPDGVLLRGWKVRPASPNGAWVLVFHGVADNRMGVLEQALILLRAGYGVPAGGIPPPGLAVLRGAHNSAVNGANA